MSNYFDLLLLLLLLMSLPPIQLIADIMCLKNVCIMMIMMMVMMTVTMITLLPGAVMGFTFYGQVDGLNFTILAGGMELYYHVELALS